MTPVSLGELVALLESIGQSPRVISSATACHCVVVGVERPEEATEGALSWLRAGRALPPTWDGTVLIVAHGHTSPWVPRTHPWAMVAVDNPRLAMARILQRWWHGVVGEIKVDPSARIHPSAVLGASDAGYLWTGDRYELFPHVGGVEIQAEVEIDPLTVVSRAAIGRTVLGRGTKVGPQVTIGHGSQVGNHCLLVAQVCLGGSTVLGDRVTMWPRATTASGVQVGAGAVIGAGAVVLCDVPPGETWAGVPARRLRAAAQNAETAPGSAFS